MWKWMMEKFFPSRKLYAGDDLGVHHACGFNWVMTTTMMMIFSLLPL
jgi:hypothetical protein